MFSRKLGQEKINNQLRDALRFLIQYWILLGFLPYGFEVMLKKELRWNCPISQQRVINKIVYKMRVPIENGSGLINQVSDSIKPSAASYWNRVEASGK